jgi:hypothetical protein
MPVRENAGIYAMLAVLIGCGLRPAEAAALRMEDLQLREEHWVIADLNGKGGHIRTVPVPDCVKAAIDHWAIPACVTSGALFRSINKAGRVWGDGFTPKVIWSIIKQAASNCFLSAVTPTIFGEPALGCATKLVANWSRSSSCLAMFRSKRRSVTWDANSTSAMRSTNISAWSRALRDRGHS